MAHGDDPLLAIRVGRSRPCASTVPEKGRSRRASGQTGPGLQGPSRHCQSKPQRNWSRAQARVSPSSWWRLLWEFSETCAPASIPVVASRFASNHVALRTLPRTLSAMRLSRLAFLFIALAAFHGPASSIPTSVGLAAIECHGCVLGSGSASSSGSSGWSISMTIGPPSGSTGNGDCFEYQGGCGAMSCTVVGTATVTGPVGTSGTSYSFCRQTGSSPTYCLSPQPTTGPAPSLTGTSSSTNRVGCGHTYTYTAEVHDPETAVLLASGTASAACSPCEP